MGKIYDAPPWLADAAKALGEVCEDGTPLALNWTQVIQAIRELRRDRDYWKKIANGQTGVAVDH